jgi:hypothetical protein
MLQAPKEFSIANGHEVFENRERKLWRCPICAWWREWASLSCCACGTARDGRTASPVLLLDSRADAVKRARL